MIDTWIFFFSTNIDHIFTPDVGDPASLGSLEPVCGDYHVTKTVADVTDGVHNFIKC